MKRGTLIATHITLSIGGHQCQSMRVAAQNDESSLDPRIQ